MMSLKFEDFLTPFPLCHTKLPFLTPPPTCVTSFIKRAPKSEEIQGMNFVFIKFYSLVSTRTLRPFLKTFSNGILQNKNYISFLRKCYSIKLYHL